MHWNSCFNIFEIFVLDINVFARKWTTDIVSGLADPQALSEGANLGVVDNL